jgi:hypothetical protein
MNGDPPAYAWDWFARQRLLWREARTRLVRADGPATGRYHALTVRPDVVAALREDYAHDPTVRRTVDAVVADVAFLGRTDAAFADVASASAPRGMRWWWTHLTGEEIGGPARRSARGGVPETQLSLDEVLGGYGDDRSGMTTPKRLPGSSGT